ncbi:MAG: TonB-dependent receptor, partial [Verrucomicrobiota bacterium]
YETLLDFVRDGLITSDFSVFPSTVINEDEASTSGVEVEWQGSLLDDSLSYLIAYTYLDTEGDNGARLLRRPRHTLGFDLQTRPTDRLQLGMGGYWVEDRVDIDPVTFGRIPGDDYFLARFYGSYDLIEAVQLKLSIENAFDEEYEEIAGFPGRGLGIFGGLTARF